MMKKIVFALVALLALAYSVVAQDTLNLQGQYMDNYFYYGNYEHANTGTYYPQWHKGGGDEGAIIEYAKRFFTDDTLTIYGLAAGIKASRPEEEDLVYDTTYTYSYEYLRLYEPSADSLLCLGQLKVHIGTTPISYYATFNPNATFPNSHIIPVYERYFSSPITVTDTFYSGMTLYTSKRYIDPYGNEWYLRCPFLKFCQLGGWMSDVEYYRGLFYHAAGNMWMDGRSTQTFSYIIPILAPPERGYEWTDTTFVASDTTMAGDTVIVCDTLVFAYDTIVQYDTLLALPERGLLGRLVGVMPNPAAETAKVVSSFGLTAVEVFNTAGERVHTLRLPDAPLTATLDVRRWPAGTYLLRIHTPQGTTVRKLVVK